MACPCTLAWNSSLDPTVTGYAIYYGVNGTANTRVNAGSATQVTLNSLSTASNYCFSVVAYNAAGMESPRSALMYYTPPAVSGLKLTRQANAVSVHFQVATNGTCHIQYTPTLSPAQWQTLTLATADANGNINVTDLLTNSVPSRFYRATVP